MAFFLFFFFFFFSNTQRNKSADFYFSRWPTRIGTSKLTARTKFVRWNFPTNGLSTGNVSKRLEWTCPANVCGNVFFLRSTFDGPVITYVHTMSSYVTDVANSRERSLRSRFRPRSCKHFCASRCRPGRYPGGRERRSNSRTPFARPCRYTVDTRVMTDAPESRNSVRAKGVSEEFFPDENV